MPQLVVRHLEDEVIARLRRRAVRHGRSMEEEARAILCNALKNDGTAVSLLGSRIAAHFGDSGLTVDLPELRDEEAQPARFR